MICNGKDKDLLFFQYFIFFGLLVFLLMGCASSPVVNSFMNPAIPAAEHSFLSVDDNIMIESIDGDMTFRSSGSGGSSFKRTPMILLIPGKHTITAKYSDSSSSVSGGMTSVTTSSTDAVSVTGTFLKGQFYSLNPDVNGNTVTFRIEEKEPSEDDKKAVASVRPPKEASFEVLMRVAQVAEPTPFEGSWKIEGPDMVSLYTFSAKTFQLMRTLKTGEMGQRGTFEYTDTAIILYPLEMYNPSDKSWFKMPSLFGPPKAEFGYSLTNGEFVMMEKGKPIGTLVKQP
jgi:hypothetical protein